jgi:hypothetical protein
MKKVAVTIQYDEEKLSTLKIYTENKGVDLSVELVKTLDSLYNKNVPMAVREFFEMKANSTKTKNTQTANNTGQQSKKNPS